MLLLVFKSLKDVMTHPQSVTYHNFLLSVRKTNKICSKYPKCIAERRDVSRVKGDHEVGGDVQPETSRVKAVYGHSLMINPSRDVSGNKSLLVNYY